MRLECGGPKVTWALAFFILGMMLSAGDLVASVLNELAKEKGARLHYAPFYLSVISLAGSVADDIFFWSLQCCQGSTSAFVPRMGFKSLWAIAGLVGTIISGVDFSRTQDKVNAQQMEKVPDLTIIGLAFSLTGLVFDVGYIGYIWKQRRDKKAEERLESQANQQQQQQNHARVLFREQASSSNPANQNSVSRRTASSANHSRA